MSEEKKPVEPLEPWPLRVWLSHLYAKFQRISGHLLAILLVGGLCWYLFGAVVRGAMHGTAAASYLEQASRLGYLPEPVNGKVPPKPSPSPEPAQSPSPTPSASPSPPAKK